MLSSSARSTQTTVVGSKLVRCFAQPGAVNTVAETRNAAMLRPRCAGGVVASMRWGLADNAVPHAAAMAGIQSDQVRGDPWCRWACTTRLRHMQTARAKLKFRCGAQPHTTMIAGLRTQPSPTVIPSRICWARSARCGVFVGFVSDIDKSCPEVGSCGTRTPAILIDSSGENASAMIPAATTRAAAWTSHDQVGSVSAMSGGW